MPKFEVTTAHDGHTIAFNAAVQPIRVEAGHLAQLRRRLLGHGPCDRRSYVCVLEGMAVSRA